MTKESQKFEAICTTNERRLILLDVQGNKLVKEEMKALKGELKMKSEMILRLQTCNLKNKEIVEQFCREFKMKSEKEKKLQEKQQILGEENRKLKLRCYKADKDLSDLELTYDRNFIEQKKLIDEFNVTRNEFLQKIEEKNQENSTLNTKLKEQEEMYGNSEVAWQTKVASYEEGNTNLVAQIEILNEKLAKSIKEIEEIPILKEKIQQLTVDLEKSEQSNAKLSNEKFQSEQKKNKIIDEYQRKLMQIQKDLPHQYFKTLSVPIVEAQPVPIPSNAVNYFSHQQRTTMVATSTAPARQQQQQSATERQQQMQQQQNASRIFARKRRMPNVTAFQQQQETKARRTGKSVTFCEDGNNSDSDSSFSSFSVVSHHKSKPSTQRQTRSLNLTNSRENLPEYVSQSDVQLPDIEISETHSPSQESNGGKKTGRVSINAKKR